MPTTQRTELNQLGEFGLIDRIKQPFEQKQHTETRKGIGDDAAVIDYGQDFYTLHSTDLLIEGVHFDLSYMPLKYLGYKAVAVNVSDIAAMNGIPQQILVSIAVSNRFSVEAIDEIYEGIAEACQNYRLDLIGGDTTTSRAGLVLNISIIGKVKKNKITYRSGARENDILCVTGDLGAAYLGLQILEREKQVFLANPHAEPQLEGKDYIVQKQLKPEARTDIVYELDELGIIPTAMIDISDGLASEILHLCKQSNVGAVIFEDKLPIEDISWLTAQELNLPIMTCALNGGEDYELLFSIAQKDFEKVNKIADVSPIGYITSADKKATLRTKSGTVYPLEAQGWKHF
ncbi:MAG: thiamine-phosphate kinase [Microscillaceae bacterium]|nr:thiamine-phosphate kinase [Microscillaceae bacterium]MDW8459919.1 thiamine-phosphate kinase [Cytophagales bacterium]